MKIADLHCDLLHYLAQDDQHTSGDPQVRCSFPQLRAGGVVLQVLAIFSETFPGSSLSGLKQSAIFQNLNRSKAHLASPKLLPAVENASALLEENEKLPLIFERLEHIGNPFYISLTWNRENRFGGGAHTSIGLKEDGIELLRWMDGRGIAIDLSHTSDALAFDILNIIDRLDIPVVASHSNCRAILDVPRNLPDELILEIIRRDGLIGVNFFGAFVGKEPSDFCDHINHFLTLGAHENLCFGADFFCEASLPLDHRRESYYFPGYEDASCYPALVRLLQEELLLSGEQTEKICVLNLMNFLNTKTVCDERSRT